MLAVAGTCHGTVSYPDKKLGKEDSFLRRALSAMLIWSKPIVTEPTRPADLENALRDYLDGYFNSFDYYPVCTRHVFLRNDAFALWSDFMKVADDLSHATEEMIISPERFLALGAMSGEELEKRKREAAEKGIKRAIEEGRK